MAHRITDDQSFEQDSNRSGNTPFANILAERISRRSVLRGGVGMASATALAGFGLVACDSGNDGGNAVNRAINLTFNPVAKNTQNNVTVPEGYSARVLYAKGDPINRNVAAYQNNGTDVDFDQRAGDEHDGMYYFGLSAMGTLDITSSNRGLLVMNHENLEDDELHVNGRRPASETGGVRVESEVLKEINAHGVSIIEVVDDGNGFQVDLDSPFNRRVTGFTDMNIAGPLRGNSKLVTRYSNGGTRTRGTFNNCANGYTPWGTYLACEENWFGYWFRGDDEALRSPSDNALHDRYGIGNDRGEGFASREWSTVPGDAFQRFNITADAAGTAQTDYRNEANNFGYIVEIDPFNPDARPQKRTALGRFGHEGCWIGPINAGEPLVFYMGDDSRGEYIYKFVSDAVWDEADAGGGQTVGNKYMDEGTLYVACFDADGTGEWLPITAEAASQVDVAMEIADDADAILGTRLVADALGATPMDRPEWGAVDPLTGEAYMTLTNNSRRGNGGSQKPDAANPRSYTDSVGEKHGRTGNVNGHIIRWREDAGNASTSFAWDIFLFGSEAGADADINLSGLTEDNDFSSPDGLWFDSRGLLWIQTDDSAINDLTNDQLLASVPGEVGDGNEITVAAADGDNTVNVKTFVGRTANTDNLRRFLVGPQGCEITGITETPDNRTLFVNVQHPATIGDNGSWPNTNGDATAVGNNTRARSATIVITRDDGGEIAI